MAMTGLVNGFPAVAAFGLRITLSLSRYFSRIKSMYFSEMTACVINMISLNICGDDCTLLGKVAKQLIMPSA